MPNRASSSAARFTVTIEPFGWRFSTDGTVPLAVAAEQALIHLPRMCRNGTCRVCLCIVRDGKVRYEIPWPGLSAEERDTGFALPCVAYPESDLTLAVPDAHRLVETDADE